MAIHNVLLCSKVRFISGTSGFGWMWILAEPPPLICDALLGRHIVFHLPSVRSPALYFCPTLILKKPLPVFDVTSQEWLAVPLKNKCLKFYALLVHFVPWKSLRWWITGLILAKCSLVLDLLCFFHDIYSNDAQVSSYTV